MLRRIPAVFSNNSKSKRETLMTVINSDDNAHGTTAQLSKWYRMIHCPGSQTRWEWELKRTVRFACAVYIVARFGKEEEIAK